MLGKISKDILSTKKEGAGVGLVIAREILEANGGGLKIESELDKGTTVTTWLPVTYLSKERNKFEQNIKEKEVNALS